MSGCGYGVTNVAVAASTGVGGVSVSGTGRCSYYCFVLVSGCLSLVCNVAVATSSTGVGGISTLGAGRCSYYCSVVVTLSKDLKLLYEYLSAGLADLTLGKSVLGTGCFLTGNYGLNVVTSNAEDITLFVELVLNAVDLHSIAVLRNGHKSALRIEVCSLADRSAILVVANYNSIVNSKYALSVRSTVSVVASGGSDSYESVYDHLSVCIETVEVVTYLSGGVCGYLTGCAGVVYTSVGIGEPYSCCGRNYAILVTVVYVAVEEYLSILQNCAAYCVTDVAVAVAGIG